MLPCHRALSGADWLRATGCSVMGHTAGWSQQHSSDRDSTLTHSTLRCKTPEIRIRLVNKRILLLQPAPWRGETRIGRRKDGAGEGRIEGRGVYLWGWAGGFPQLVPRGRRNGKAELRRGMGGGGKGASEFESGVTTAPAKVSCNSQLQVGSVGVPVAESMRLAFPEPWQQEPPRWVHRQDGTVQEVWNSAWDRHKHMPYTTQGECFSRGGTRQRGGWGREDSCRAERMDRTPSFWLSWLPVSMRCRLINLRSPPRQLGRPPQATWLHSTGCPVGWMSTARQHRWPTTPSTGHCSSRGGAACGRITAACWWAALGLHLAAGTCAWWIRVAVLPCLLLLICNPIACVVIFCIPSSPSLSPFLTAECFSVVPIRLATPARLHPHCT